MIARKWEPITRLAPDCEYDFAEIDSLRRQWLSVRQAREEANPKAYSGFLDRLTRSWAIETGIIEGLYTLDRGVTETLVMRGISEELIEQSSTNKDPGELVRMLRDHQDAAEGVHHEIREGRPISRSAIRQIHSTLTRNQPTYRAVDQFGNSFDTPLHHGQFKTLPNNPIREDGSVHEYCPPEQVDSELDLLVEWYGQYQQETDAHHPILSGVWLHHRFTQIHPFQDGNGRVARTLLTWHLVREGYLPVVIKRDDRDRYIDALESADGDDLRPFVDLLVQLQKQTILEALGEPESDPQPALVGQVLDHIVEQIDRQNQARADQMRLVSSLAQGLQEQAQLMLAEQADLIRTRLSEADRQIHHRIDRGGPDGKEHWYRNQVVITANNSRHWVNFNEARFFVKVSFTPESPSRYPRLIFVVSLHHMGRQLTGIMAATAFALIQHYHDNTEEDNEGTAETQFHDCTIEPFTFTWETDSESLMSRFNNWLKQHLAIAVKKWGEYLT